MTIALAIDYVDNLLIADEYKDALCGDVEQKALGFHELTAIRAVSQIVARVLYNECSDSFRQNSWVGVKNFLF